MNAPAPPGLTVIGGGAMAEAILTGAFVAGILEPKRVIVAEPDAGRRGVMSRLGVRVCERAGDALRGVDSTGEWQTLLAVKPQSLAGVAADVAGAPTRGVVMSILAGKTSAAAREAMGGSCRVVRVMPNLPARIGRGVTAVALGAGAAAGDDALARRLFAGVGEVVPIDESLMDAFTALVGSGPAYLFYLAQAMAKAGERVGFDAATADRVVRGALAGSAELLARSTDRSAADLRASVTSKGGTTEAAIRVFDEAGLMDAVVRAIIAARDRGAELNRA